MPTPPLTHCRIAIFEDNPTGRQRLSSMVTLCGATAIPVNGPAPKLDMLQSYLTTQHIDLVICDHHLSQQSDYASYYGAEAVAKSYTLGVGGILVTAFEESDAELSLRRYRRQIPALIRSPGDLDRKSLQAALILADNEVRKNKPPRERVPHRTIMTVQRVEPRGTAKIVKVIMGQWDGSQEVGFPLDLVPRQFQKSVEAGAILIAEVNIEAIRQEDLFFDKFELPDSDVLEQAKNLFIRS